MKTMRCFTLLVCLFAAAANAAYNYNAPQQHGSIGGIGGIQQLSPQIHHQQHHQLQQHHHHQVISQPQQEVVNKEFYTFTAPEADFAEPQLEQQISSSNKKNVQVIFIHAPEQTAINRAVQNLVQQTTEQQTAIYVLTKQADIAQLTRNIHQENQHISHKPEVHFIKYRTPEDAARAQHSIRAQYDHLSGSSLNAGESIAPVLNFASQQQHSHQHQQQQPTIIGGPSAIAPQVPAQAYLPIRV